MRNVFRTTFTVIFREITPDVMEEFDASDYDRLQDAYFNFFLEGSRRRL